MHFSRLLALTASFAACVAAAADPSEPRVITSAAPGDLNALILSLIRTMPSGGAYATTAAANQLCSRPSPSRQGGLEVDPSGAKPSYCSSATYLVFAKVVEELSERGVLSLDRKALRALLVAGQSDGYGVWGRWNANGRAPRGSFTS
jgi:hypothetical protein